MNVGLIGCGFIGKKHVDAIAQTPHLKLTAVCDIDEGRARELTNNYRAMSRQTNEIAYFQSYRHLLGDEGVDIVVITVPSGLHAAVAMEAVNQQRHVVLEKPMTLSLGEALSLTQRAKAMNVKVAVCHQKRFYSHLQEIKQLLQKNRLGKIVGGNLCVFYNRDEAYYTSQQWRGTWEMDGGVLLNQGIHDLDILLWLVGRPESIWGQLRRQLRPIEAEDTAAAVLAMKDGALFSFAATVCAPRDYANEALTIVGTNGTFTLSGKQLEPSVWEVSGVPMPQPGANQNPYVALYRDVIKAIHENRPPWIGADDGMGALEVIFAMYQSQRTGCAVTLPGEALSTIDLRDMFK